ncbi:MAG: methyltransferase type 11 [Latescibacteria bacterium DG_63]|nr:MAG: methyltransferase type 11 [Latescibacteria bacterium DG_63]
MPKSDSFDRNVDRYEAWFERNKLAHESELKAVRALLPRRGEGLEVGVGTGRFAAPLGVGLGVEPSRAMGRFAQERGIQVLVGVGEHLAFADNCFDFVLLITTICFLDDVSAALAETYRVLRPGGVVLIGFIDRESQLGRVYEKRKQNDVFYRDASFLSADEVLSRLKETGFRDPVFRQTIFENPAEMTEADSVKSGHGEGSFVVVRAARPSEP